MIQLAKLQKNPYIDFVKNPITAAAEDVFVEVYQDYHHNFAKLRQRFEEKIRANKSKRIICEGI